MTPVQVIRILQAFQRALTRLRAAADPAPLLPPCGHGDVRPCVAGFWHGFWWCRSATAWLPKSQIGIRRWRRPWFQTIGFLGFPLGPPVIVIAHVEPAPFRPHCRVQLMTASWYVVPVAELNRPLPVKGKRPVGTTALLPLPNGGFPNKRAFFSILLRKGLFLRTAPQVVDGLGFGKFHYGRMPLTLVFPENARLSTAFAPNRVSLQAGNHDPSRCPPSFLIL